MCRQHPGCIIGPISACHRRVPRRAPAHQRPPRPPLLPQALGDARAAEYMRGRRIMEVNPDHPIIQGLKGKVELESRWVLHAPASGAPPLLLLRAP